MARQQRIPHGHRVRVRTRGGQDHDRRRLARWPAGGQACPLGARRGRRRGGRTPGQAPRPQEGLRHMNTPQVPPYPPGRNLLAGKNVLVTAAAGTGIGFATARRCLEEGARVYVSDLHERRLAEAVERLRAIEPDLVEGKLCDVTRETDVRALVAAAIAAMGRVDVLVNNAGLGGSAAVTEMTDEQWHKVLDVSLTSVFRMTRAMLPHMYANGGGAI